MRFIKDLYLKINEFNARAVNKKLRARLKNHDFSIICNNCLGGVIYHNLGLEFKSPTINLDFLPEDFLTFISDLNYYTTAELYEISGTKIITGMLKGDGSHKDVMVRFHHYKTFDEASQKWKVRLKRINKDNLFFIYEHYEGDDISYLERYCDLARRHDNFLAITHKNHGFKNEVAHRHYKNDSKSGKLCKWKFLSGKRYLDEINYVSFLNDCTAFWNKKDFYENSIHI